MPVIGSRGAWQGHERLNDEARRAVAWAEAAAAERGLRQASPDLLLLGLLVDEASVASRALISLTWDLARTRREVEEGIPRRGDVLEGRSMLDAASREAVVLGLNEARRSRFERAGSGHLFLGLLQAREGRGVKSMVSRGLSLPVLRERVEQLEGEASATSAAAYSTDTLADDSLRQAFAKIGGLLPCSLCGAPMHESFRYCYRCGRPL